METAVASPSLALWLQLYPLRHLGQKSGGVTALSPFATYGVRSEMACRGGVRDAPSSNRTRDLQDRLTRVWGTLEMDEALDCGTLCGVALGQRSQESLGVAARGLAQESSMPQIQCWGVTEYMYRRYVFRMQIMSNCITLQLQFKQMVFRIQLHC